ncbi:MULTISPECIES: hypothetical protein [Rhodococcus]|uniref:hypothetical protein n=1 Tax=Rhodococcus TaxID=1827 RepID=UPI0007AECB1A|nr:MULTISPECIES: hypothetical protein [Rhodococcus]KZL33208.1 hypothetical protein A3852_13000 [Rhodococcus qingshengii]MCE4161632.1 hypothetical protein [Rhodococcus sp. Ni2]
MASGKSTITQPVMTCPACNVEVQATFSTELTMESIDVGGYNGKMPGTATVTVTGMRVSHDCIPTTKRSIESQNWASYGR